MEILKTGIPRGGVLLQIQIFLDLLLKSIIVVLLVIFMMEGKFIKQFQ